MLHQVGVGALGPVFRTYEPTRDRLVAVKVFRLDIVPEQARALADELSRAADAGLFHPSIVEPIAAGVEGTVAYRAEEYVAAESLDVAMRHYAPAPLEKALPFITQLAGAIDFARAAGVGHGALHPRDIFVTPDDARATGFGVVEALERAGVRAPVRRPYTAPERIERGEWGTPADVFSLAAIAFELLTGRRPAGTGPHIGALIATEEGRTDAVHAVLARAMDDDPSRRYPNALAFAGALESAARSDRGEGRSAPAAPSPRSIAPAIASAPEAPPSPPPLPTPVPPPSARVSKTTPVQTPGEFTIEETLDPIHAAIEDAAPSAAKDVRFASLFDAEPAASTTLSPETASPDDEMDDVSSVDRFTPEDEIAAQLSDADAQRPLEAAYETAPTTGDFSAGEPRFRDREPTFGMESDAREAPERSRPGILPIAVTLVIGLLLGFAAGFFVGGRDRTASPSSAPAATTARTQPPPQAANPSPKQFSDQSVTSPAPSQAPSSASPPPSDAPPTVSEDAPSAAAPAPRVPASAPRTTPPATAPTIGRIVVRSTPARASVTVNGHWRGRTPLTLEKLPFGRYVVRVVEPGYRIESQEFALSARDSAHTIDARLQPDRAATSRTPAPGRLPATPPAPKPGTSPPAANGAFTGALYVDSRPQGANVLLDGRIVGKTPLRLSDVRIGTHVVRLELPEHRPWSSVARVTAGQEFRVTGSLERFQ